MAKQCPEEFNPWPPFVDIFASVILVLMLFLLITVVNIGYYAQFKFKKAYTGSTESPVLIQSERPSKIKVDYCEKREEVVKIEKQDELITFHKVDASHLEKDANNSLFSGGTSEGNAVRYAAAPTPVYQQKLTTKSDSAMITFDNKEIFLTAKIKQKLRQFVQKNKSANVHFYLSVSDPQKIHSATLARQISLGRVLNMKKVIYRMHIPKKNIHLQLHNDNPHISDYGTVLIKAERK